MAVEGSSPRAASLHDGDGNVLLLSYDGVIRDLAVTVRRVAAFGGFPLREEEMPRILERCSVPFMKQHTEKLDPRSRQLGPQREAFIRQGRAGAGGEALSPAQKATLTRKLAALARRLRSPSAAVPYGADAIQISEKNAAP